MQIKKLLRIVADQRNPLHALISTINESPSRWKRNIPKPLTFNASRKLLQFDIQVSEIVQIQYPKNAPWLIDVGRVVSTDLAYLKKEFTPNIIYKQRLQEVLDKINANQIIFTDGSKNAETGGYSFVDKNGCILKKRGHNKASIFSLEATAILDAIRYAITLDGVTAIVTDSLSSLRAVQKSNIRNSIATEIRDHLTNSLRLIWCPSHIGIYLNEEADRQAQLATNNPTIENSDLRNEDAWKEVHRNLRRKYDLEWKEISILNKLRSVKESLYEDMATYGLLSRSDAVKLARMRIGHIKSTHDFVFSRGQPPICIICNRDLTVEHILLHCQKFGVEREENGLAETLPEVLSLNVHSAMKVIQFLRNCNLYSNV